MDNERSRNQFKTIDEYIASFPANVQHMLRELRDAIKEAAPDAEETISYGMPAFKLNGILVYFAAHKNHIGFYPTSSGIRAFGDKLSVYKHSKGAVQFPLEGPIPFDIVKEIVRFRVEENMIKAHKSGVPNRRQSK